MFGWFSPKCPVDAHAKQWVEERLLWLSCEFGHDVFTRRALILPLAEFFPDPNDASDQSVRVLLERVCRYMDADSERVELKFLNSSNSPGLVNDRGYLLPVTVGLYEGDSDKTVIHLDTRQLGDPMSLVGTMAHELAHLRLLGERRIRNDVFDNELLTDLTVVFHGLGIFLANAGRSWTPNVQHWPATRAQRPEYMTQPMIGYALAHAAWFRGERKPKWARHLRLDARPSFKQGLRYLWATGDSKFRPAKRK